MSTKETQADESMRVEATSWYMADQSNPEERRYVFSYTINIYNDGSEPAKLLTRHWLITDADGKVQEVHGDGVIGKQPVIQPGERHTYSSGTVIETPVGTMEGRYGMASPSGDHFDIPIPIFRLAMPGILN